jgi:hypothetical protein
MPLHAFIKKMYEGSLDPLYFIRFLDYLIYKRVGPYCLTIDKTSVDIMITGVLVDTEKKREYFSLHTFYKDVTGKEVQFDDMTVLKEILVKPDYSIWRLICMVKEQEIIEFFDQKYGIFLMFRDLRKKIKEKMKIDIVSKIVIHWNGKEFNIKKSTIATDDPHYVACVCNLLENYHSGKICGLYYVLPNNEKLLISDL